MNCCHVGIWGVAPKSPVHKHSGTEALFWFPWSPWPNFIIIRSNWCQSVNHKYFLLPPWEDASSVTPLPEESGWIFPPKLMLKNTYHLSNSVHYLDLRPILFKVDEECLFGAAATTKFISHRCLSCWILNLTNRAIGFLNFYRPFSKNSSDYELSQKMLKAPAFLAIQRSSMLSAMTLEGIQASRSTTGSDARCLVSLTLRKES